MFDNLRKAAEVSEQSGTIGEIKESLSQPTPFDRIRKSAGQARKPEAKDRERRDHPAAPGLIPRQGAAPGRHNGNVEGTGGTRIFGSNGKEIPNLSRKK